MGRTAKRGAQHVANIVVVALSSKSGNQIPSGGSNEAIVIRITHEELGKLKAQFANCVLALCVIDEIVINGTYMPKYTKV